MGKIVKILKKNIYIEQEDDGRNILVKNITFENHPWFSSKKIDRETLFDRIISSYQSFSEHGFGPKVFHIKRQKIKRRDTITVKMEWIPIMMNETLVEENEDLITEKIGSLHEKGIYHGDLHGGNLAMREDGSIVFLDLETVFYKSEISSQSPIFSLIKWWVSEGFEMDIDEFIEYELNENWQNIPE
jgi:hypothetical protein